MKFKKIFISIFLCVMTLGLFMSSVSARSCGQEIINEVNEKYQAVVDAGCEDVTTGRCRALYASYQEAKDWADAK